MQTVSEEDKIVSKEDNLHEVSDPILTFHAKWNVMLFSRKKSEKYFKMSSAEVFNQHAKCKVFTEKLVFFFFCCCCFFFFK